MEKMCKLIIFSYGICFNAFFTIHNWGEIMDDKNNIKIVYYEQLHYTLL